MLNQLTEAKPGPVDMKISTMHQQWTNNAPARHKPPPSFASNIDANLIVWLLMLIFARLM